MPLATTSRLAFQGSKFAAKGALRGTRAVLRSRTVRGLRKDIRSGASRAGKALLRTRTAQNVRGSGLAKKTTALVRGVRAGIKVARGQGTISSRKPGVPPPLKRTKPVVSRVQVSKPKIRVRLPSSNRKPAVRRRPIGGLK